MNLQQSLDKILINAQKHQQQLAIMLATLLASLTGYYVYIQYHEHHVRDASLAYYKILSDNDSSEDTRRKALTELTTKYKSTVYAELAQAKIAKLASEEHDYAAAISAYKSAIINCKSSHLQELFRLRLAKIYILAKQPTQALDLLSKITNDIGYIKPIISIDARLQLKQYDQARAEIEQQIAHINPIDNSEKKLAYELLHERLTLIKNDKK